MIHEVELTGYDVKYAGDGTLTLGTWDSYGIEKLHITADSDWDGLTVLATFRIGSTSVRALMDGDGMVSVPPEATSEAGSGVIVFSGTDGEMLRVSRNLKYKVMDHDPIDGDDSQPTPSEFEQFVSQVNDARIDAQQAAVESAKNSTAAAQSAQTAEEASGSARSSADLAQAVASGAGAAQEAAQQSARTAEGQANAAGSQAALAAQSAQAAEQSYLAALLQADLAGQKSEEAGTSASAAANSAREAQAQAELAESNAQDAASHNEAAAVSAQAAAASAGNAAESCARAESAAEQAAGSAEQAANSAQDSASHADRAQAAADRAEQVADFDPSDFATAEQGTRADAAVQSVNGKSGNSITLQAGDIGAATAAQGGRADTAVQTVNNKSGTSITLGAADVGAATTAQGAKADTAVQPDDLSPYAKTADLPDNLPNPYSLSIRFNGATQATYNGSSQTMVNITPNGIGAATRAQGAKADSALQPDALSGYALKSEIPVSPSDINAATAAQGQKADTAVQSVNGVKADADGTVTIPVSTTKIVLLWTNSSPSSTFPAKKVSLSLSGYHAVLVLGWSYSAEAVCSSILVPVGSKGVITLVGTGTAYRNFSTSSSGVTFEAASVENTATPYKIYGIKL